MLKFDFHNNLVEQKSFCDLPFRKIILSSGGEVSMCCHQYKQLGILKENNNVLDFWQGQLAKEIRETTNQNKLHQVCSSGCSCPFISSEKTERTFLVYDKLKYPTHLEICLPDSHCNIGGTNPNEENPACIMCKRNFTGNTQKDITDFLCRKSLPLMPYLNEFTLLGIAEPFWKDAIFNVFQKLNFSKHKHHIKFSTNTNGTCLNEKTTRRFFEETTTSNISWSFDAATPITFQKIRRLDAFDLINKNISRFIEMRREYGGKDKHVVSIWNNINMLNVEEMPLMVQQAIDLHVDYMIMVPTYEQQGLVKLGELVLNRKNYKIFKKFSEEAKEIADKNNFYLGYPTKFDVPLTSFDKNFVQIQ